RVWRVSQQLHQRSILADHDNKEGPRRKNSEWPAPVGRQQRSFSDNRRPAPFYHVNRVQTTGPPIFTAQGANQGTVDLRANRYPRSPSTVSTDSGREFAWAFTRSN